MAKLIGMIIWGFCAYKIAKTMKDNEGLDVNPINYAIISVLFSFILSMCVLFNKYSKVKGNIGMNIATWLVGAFIVMLNLLIIFL